MQATESRTKTVHMWLRDTFGDHTLWAVALPAGREVLRAVQALPVNPACRPLHHRETPLAEPPSAPASATSCAGKGDTCYERASAGSVVKTAARQLSVP